MTNPFHISVTVTHKRSHYFFVPQILALVVVGPLAWMAFDRAPPLDLYDGIIDPNDLPKGGTASVTWRATFSGRDCPGATQRELVDSRRGLWPQLTRERKGVFKPDEDNSRQGTVTTPPLELPEGMSSGPATYRVTNFYYCNWLQHALHWPIVRVSPPIHFEVLP